MDNIVYILCCLYFCYKSFCDFLGSDLAIREEYLHLPGRKTWQKRKAIFEAIIGVGALLFLLFQRNRYAVVIIGLVVLASFILMIRNNAKYMRSDDSP